MKTQTTRNAARLVLAIYAILLVVHIRRFPAARTPPLEHIFQELKQEFYVEYLSTGQVPADLSFMSPRASRLMKIYADSFSWDPTTQSFTYTYDKPYPINRCTIPYILTLGLLDTEPKSTASGISADSITNNAPLYKALGQL